MLFYNIASITKTEDSVQHGIKPVPENVIEIYDSNIAGITDLNNYIYYRLEFELPTDAGFNIGENGVTRDYIKQIIDAASIICS